MIAPYQGFASGKKATFWQTKQASDLEFGRRWSQFGQEIARGRVIVRK